MYYTSKDGDAPDPTTGASTVDTPTSRLRPSRPGSRLPAKETLASRQMYGTPFVSSPRPDPLRDPEVFRTTDRLPNHLHRLDTRGSGNLVSSSGRPSGEGNTVLRSLPGTGKTIASAPSSTPSRDRGRTTAHLYLGDSNSYPVGRYHGCEHARSRAVAAAGREGPRQRKEQLQNRRF